MPSAALDYDKIAEKLGEGIVISFFPSLLSAVRRKIEVNKYYKIGYTKSTVYQRLYYLKNKLNPAGSTTAPRTKATPKGKKRKIDEDTA